MKPGKIFLVLILILSAVINLSAEIVNINIYSLNDFHGYLTEGPKNPGIAKLYARMKERMEKTPGENMILAAGDMFQGTIESNLLYGQNMIEIMNFFGVDAMCPGNHEFDWGQDRLRENAELSKFPWLCANVVSKTSGGIPEYFKPYAILDKKGVKIGIIGLVTPTTVLNANPKLLAGLEFLAPQPVTEKYVRVLKDAGADIIILLTHLGSAQDSKTGKITGESADIAAATNVLDVVFAAHTHIITNGKVNNTVVIQAYEYGKAFGLVQIAYDNKAKKTESIKSEVVRIDPSDYPSIKPDAKVEEILDKSLGKVEEIKHQVTGSCKAPLLHKDTLDNRMATQIGCFTTDIEREKAQADICLLSWGTWRTSLPPSKKPGDITMGDLYMCLPLDNTLYTLEMKGSSIRKALEYGIKNPTFGMVQFSGLKIRYDESLPWGKGIVSAILNDGSPLEDNAWYKVVTTDFLANGGGGYPGFSEGRNGHDTGILTRDMVREYLKSNPLINYKQDDRFELVVTRK